MIGTDFDTATTALCSKMITHAENEVNKYLSKRYDISSFTSSVPPLVTSLTETLTEGYTYQRMSRGNKEWRDRGLELVNMALENLKLISEYKLDLVDSSGNVLTDMSNTAFRCLSSTDSYANTFNEDSELNWKIDSTKLDDIESERS